MFLKSLNITRLALGVFFCAGILLFSQNVSAQSTISGTVYDRQRNQMPNVDVELLNEFYQQINRTRTDGAGRYDFGGLRDGRYTIKVLPFRYDYQDQSQLIEINTMNIRGGQGTSYEIRDFYLEPKKGSLADTETGVIFAQEVPEKAERAFEQAIKDYSKKRTDESIKGLREAIDIFPDYFQALLELGKTLAIKGEFGEAVPLLLKAAEINPKSPTALFYLGYSLHKYNYNKAAITALNQAHILAPASIQILLALGTAERLEGKFNDAETHLVKAKKLTKESVPDIHWELAQLYGNNLKKYKEAADELQQYLKAGKYDEEHTKQVKKLISNFQDKAKSVASKS